MQLYIHKIFSKILKTVICAELDNNYKIYRDLKQECML